MVHVILDIKIAITLKTKVVEDKLMRNNSTTSK